MIASTIDSLLTRLSYHRAGAATRSGGATRPISTRLGRMRCLDTGTPDDGRPCILVTPDGPNVLEHLMPLVTRLALSARVVAFEMPGFGHSLPHRRYRHSLDDGAGAVLGMMDALGISRATLAFSCANGLYAIRAAQSAPSRVSALVLAQTPSLGSMRDWARRNVPPSLHWPGVGQVAGWLMRRRAIEAWYARALPPGGDPRPWRDMALHASTQGGCFCLAGIVQGLMREQPDAPRRLDVPLTLAWGGCDRSHRDTSPYSILDDAPNAEIVHFQECGHFPDVEQPDRFAQLVLERAC